MDKEKHYVHTNINQLFKKKKCCHLWQHGQALKAFCEVNQVRQRRTTNVRSHMWNLKKTELPETGSRWVSCWGLVGAGGNEEMLAKGSELTVMRGMLSGDTVHNRVTKANSTVLYT